MSWILPLNVLISIQRICLHDLEQRAKVILSRLGVVEDVSALLVVNLGDTVEEGGLEAQGHWCLRMDDGVAGFANIDGQDLFLVDLGGGGVCADGGDEPGNG